MQRRQCKKRLRAGALRSTHVSANKIVAWRHDVHPTQRGFADLRSAQLSSTFASDRDADQAVLRFRAGFAAVRPASLSLSESASSWASAALRVVPPPLAAFALLARL